MHGVVFIYVLCVVFIYVSINKNYRGIFNLGGHWRNMFVEEGIWVFLKKMLRFSKWSFIVILQLFQLITIAVWNIKQTIMKDYNIQSCQWMMCSRFCQPFLLCTTFCSFLCSVQYFLCIFSKNGYLFIGYR